MQEFQKLLELLKKSIETLSQLRIELKIDKSRKKSVKDHRILKVEVPSELKLLPQDLAVICALGILQGLIEKRPFRFAVNFGTGRREHFHPHFMFPSENERLVSLVANVEKAVDEVLSEYPMLAEKLKQKLFNP